MLDEWLVKDLIMKCRNISFRTYLILKSEDKILYAGIIDDMPYTYFYYRFKSFKVIDSGVEVEIVLE